jgi:hypothetical protein
MIAKNYLKHPEALRFQRELFHNGFKNSPRIMRLVECIFNFAPTTPQWAKDLARKARNLVKAWKEKQMTVNFSQFISTAVNQTVPFVPTTNPRFRPGLEVKYNRIQVQGSYRSFCQAHNNWAADRRVYQYAGSKAP